MGEDNGRRSAGQVRMCLPESQAACGSRQPTGSGSSGTGGGQRETLGHPHPVPSLSDTAHPPFSGGKPPVSFWALVAVGVMGTFCNWEPHKLEEFTVFLLSGTIIVPCDLC